MITIETIVDNAVQRGSALWGEHGVSFAISATGGRILFDTGQSGEVLVHNAGIMQVPLNQFDALVVSHAHYDHTGGLERFMAFARPGMPLYANPGFFAERFSIDNENPEAIGLRLTKDLLSQHFDIRLNQAPVEILPGVWTAGQVADRRYFEGRSPNHFVRENGQWLPDPYQDDLSLVLDSQDGLIIVCGCCHAGLLNTIVQIHRTFDKKIQAIIGGTHLTSASNENLDQAVHVLKSFDDGGGLRLYPNHCTGERAYLRLAQVFGDQLQPCPAGTRLQFR